jgi:septum site-determining protein MinC
LNDDCSFQAILQELKEKMASTHNKILEGPEIQVQIRLGKRLITDQQKRLLTELITAKKNLSIHSWDCDVVPKEMLTDETGKLKVIQHIVRSGQVVHHNGDLLLIGDVNPGGTITSTGDVYILGSLRGIAHAGIEGNQQAIIIASHMKPTQLRIAEMISRPPDEWGIDEATMEFAYLNNGVMEIDKIIHIGRIRPDGVSFRGA